MATQEDRIGHTEPLGQLFDEETPLLAEEPRTERTEHTDNNGDGNEEREQTVLVKDISNTKIAIILGATWIGVFLGALDSTIIATLSAPISTSFNSLSLLSWLASAYLIANAACQPISGRLTDIFSRRTGLVVSNILFGAGNLMCGLATSERTMIAGRVVAGMGGGGLMAITTFVSTDLVPLRKRGLIQGIGNILYGTGAGIGGVFGGWINDTWGWRMAFYAQVPLVVVSAILVYIYVDIPPKESKRSNLSRIDFPGASTLVISLILLLLALNSGGNVVPWSHPLVLTTLPLSLLFLIAFIWIEARWIKDPVIPVNLLLVRTVGAACLTNWFTTMGIFMVYFYAPIFFQVRGLSTTQAGLHLIPISAGSSAGSLLAGYSMTRTGKYKLAGLALIISLAIGTGLLTLLSLSSPEWPSFIALFLTGAGYGGMLTVTLIACLSAVAHADHAVISSATYAFRSTGSAIGITIGSAVYQNLLKTGLWERFGAEPGAAEEINRIRDSFDELTHLPPGWRDGVYEAYMDALRGVFVTALGAVLIGLGCACFIREHTLHTSLTRK